MRLSISIIDKRVKPGTSYRSTPEYEDYERVSITDAGARKAVIAGVLRSIADDIDPQPDRPEPSRPFDDGLGDR